MASITEIEKCIEDWYSGAATRADVIYILHGFPTLSDKIELLSRLPEFVQDAKESVAILPKDSDEWRPGAHIPRTDCPPPTPEQLKIWKQHSDDHLSGLWELRDYLFG